MAGDTGSTLDLAVAVASPQKRPDSGLQMRASRRSPRQSPPQHEGKEVTPCQLRSSCLTHPNRSVSSAWARWSSLTGHGWGTLSGRRGKTAKNGTKLCLWRVFRPFKALNTAHIQELGLFCSLEAFEIRIRQPPSTSGWLIGRSPIFRPLKARSSLLDLAHVYAA